MGAQSASTRLYYIIQEVAPVDSRHGVWSAHDTMRRAGESESRMLLALADILSNGLRHGNWPAEPYPHADWMCDAHVKLSGARLDARCRRPRRAGSTFCAFHQPKGD